MIPLASLRGGVERRQKSGPKAAFFQMVAGVRITVPETPMQLDALLTDEMLVGDDHSLQKSELIVY